MRSWAVLGLVACAACAACAQILGADFDDTSSTHAGGAGGAGGVAGAAGTDASLQPECPELHVSPLGDDASSGCLPHPKKTINAALEVARSSKVVTGIRICAGTFPEQILLDTVVDLRGGYSCSDWKRPASWGFPAFDPSKRTVVGGKVAGHALRITSQAASSLVEGLMISGPADAKEKDGVAVRVDASAKPHISNCFIQAGPTFSFDGDGSVGVRIGTGATPEIESNRIDGGTGRTNSPGGVGRAAIVVESAFPFIHDNEIRGGANAPQTSDGLASAGVVVRGASVMTEANGNPLRSNVLHGGDGIGPLGGLASIGVSVVDESSVDIVKCAIEPGHSLGTGDPVPDGGNLGTAVQLRGVHFESTGALRVLQSRIYGGDLSNPAQPGEGFRVGVWVASAASFLAENTVIHAGAADRTPGVEGSPNFAIRLGFTKDPVVRHSSLYSGPSGFPTVGTALKVDPGVTGAIVENSLLAADNNWNEPFYVEKCATAGVFARVNNNLLFNVPRDKWAIDSLFGYGETPGLPCGAWQPVESIADMETHLTTSCTKDGPTPPCKAFGGTVASGNKTLRADCGGDPGCISWPECGSDSLACMQSVFSSWTALQKPGYVALFGEGWTLSPSLPCVIAKSSLEVNVPVDLLGNARIDAPSMGAFEQDSCVP
jgi:hypothetical protein